eukprot:1485285-Pyramimonas_sp.AAC.1
MQPGHVAEVASEAGDRLLGGDAPAGGSGKEAAQRQGNEHPACASVGFRHPKYQDLRYDLERPIRPSRRKFTARNCRHLHQPIPVPQ